MSVSLSTLCGNACGISTDASLRKRSQSFTCSDFKSKSELTVRFVQSKQGLAFVTDHVVPAGNSLSCDWCICHCLAMEETDCQGVLVELKGGDFGHAVRQLASTFSELRKVWPSLSISRCYAVLSGRRIPSIKSKDYKVVTQYRLPGFHHFRARKGLAVDI